MRSITIGAFAIVATFILRPADAQTLYTCGEGTVRGVQAIVQPVAQPPVILIVDAEGEPQVHVTRAPDEPRAAYLVTVQLFDEVYTGEAFAAEPENFDPTQLTTNDTISVCVNRQQMILDRGDGTDFRAQVVRSAMFFRPTGTR